MKKIYPLPLVVSMIIFFGCTTRQKAIQFKPVGETEYNYAADSSFAVPHGKVWEERKKIRDSCNQNSYEANAFFMRTSDSFRLGSIVNMKTMQVVKNPDPQIFFGSSLGYMFNFSTNTCTVKKTVNIPVDSFMNKVVDFKIDSSNENINNELMNAIRHSTLTEIESGTWVNMEISDVFTKLLDTTTNAVLLDYKKLLLSPDNMILAKSSSITDLSFYFHTKDLLTQDLKNKLQSKPIVAQQPYLKVEFIYLDDHSFRIILFGALQLTGQFMKCELQ